MVLRSGNSTHQDLLSNANSALSAGSRLGEVQFSTFYLYLFSLQNYITVRGAVKCPSSTLCDACGVNRSAIMLMCFFFICCSRGRCQSKSLSDKSI